MLNRLKHIRIGWGAWALVAFYVYLIIHTLSGDQGLMRWAQARSSVTQYEVTLADLETQKKDLESQVERLDASSLHLDTLDRLAREKLFLAHPNEIVIFFNAESPVVP